MVEVTDEMKQALTNIQHGFQLISCEGGVKLVFSDSFLEKALTRIIELHESNKPKPEPFVYYKKQPWGYDECDYDDEGSFPLYDAPPTREPLSDYKLREILNGINEGDGTIYDFARAVEQAHGIGVTND